MQIMESPKDARTGTSSRLHQAPRPLSQPPSSLFIIYESGCQHPPENKCPFVLRPPASPAFCPRPACPASCAQLARRMLAAAKCSCGASCTQPTWHSLHGAVPAQGLERPRTCSFCPTTELASHCGTEKQPSKQSLPATEGASQALTFQ